jgi:hypothetical protein
MKIYSDFSHVLAAMCVSHNKWGIYMSNSFDGEISPLELKKAAPFLPEDELVNFWHQGFAVVLLDSEGEMRECYEQIVGDDGPTSSNSYSGPARIYAMTCDPAGRSLTENT